MSLRLPIDANLLGYWGFDEANETDVALDEGTNAINLNVVASTGVRAARIGNGRQFDGVNTIARPVGTSSPLYFWSYGTIICWITLDSVNSGGDLLRPIVAIDGATGSFADNTILYLGVDSQGRITYRYDQNITEPIVFKSPASTILTGRYYSIMLTQDFNTLNQSIVTLYVDNVQVPWSSLTVNGVPQADPNAPAPPPMRSAIPTSTLVVGSSNKSTSKWQGVIDELSLHKTVRNSAYLRAAYFRLTQALSFTKLTGTGVKTIGAVEMGGGNRWWAYERDQSLFIIRENSLGLFSAEIQLTTGGNLPSGAPMPAGSEQPRLAYDKATDTLLIAFLGAGRVYKITAASGDAAATQNMPYTQDTPTIIKVRDTVDATWQTGGEHTPTPDTGKRTSGPGMSIVGDVAAPTILSFYTPPVHASFGVAVTGGVGYGVALYRRTGKEETLVGIANTLQTERPANGGYYWFPIAANQRVKGSLYVAYSVKRNGDIGRAPSNVIEDWLGDMEVRTVLQPNNIVWNRAGDALTDLTQTAPGDTSQRLVVVYVNRLPVKISTPDTWSGPAAGDTGLFPAVGYVNRSPVKLNLLDSWPNGASAGEATGATMSSSRANPKVVSL